MQREAHPGKGPGETPSGFPQRSCYLGVDIGRKRDLTVLWLLEEENPEGPAEARTYVTRGVRTLDRQPFAQQRAVLDELLALRAESQISNVRFEIRRCAVDASGLGAMLAEELAAQWGARVEPVVFTAAVKEALAVRVKRLLEERRLKIPYDPAIRAALGAVKRFVTAAGNVRFDAERTEAAGHADHFWALALALHAAEEPGLSVEYVSSAQPRRFALSEAF
jgi:phage FluMu gp28-like protein